MITVDERIDDLEKDIIINLNMAEDYSFRQYYPYIKLEVEELTILKKAKKIREKRKNLSESDF